MRNWRHFAPAFVLAIGCALLASARRPERALLRSPLGTLQVTVAGFAVDERVISDDEQRVAGMHDYVYRVFQRDSGSAFSVYVGYYESQATGKTIHSPRNCLPGAGWQAVESGPKVVATDAGEVTVNRYILANGQVQALVYYWYQGRGRVAWNEYRVKWDLLRDAALRGRTEEALVRIMIPLAPSRGSDAEEWQRRQKDADDLAATVARKLIPTLQQSLPQWDEIAAT